MAAIQGYFGISQKTLEEKKINLGLFLEVPEIETKVHVVLETAGTYGKFPDKPSFLCAIVNVLMR